MTCATKCGNLYLYILQKLDSSTGLWVGALLNSKWHNHMTVGNHKCLVHVIFPIMLIATLPHCTSNDFHKAWNIRSAGRPNLLVLSPIVGTLSILHFSHQFEVVLLCNRLIFSRSEAILCSVDRLLPVYNMAFFMCCDGRCYCPVADGMATAGC